MDTRQVRSIVSLDEAWMWTRGLGDRLHRLMMYCNHVPGLPGLTVTPYCDEATDTALLRFRFDGTPGQSIALRSWARTIAELTVIDTDGWSADKLAAFRQHVTRFRCHGTAPKGSLDELVTCLAVELVRWSRRALQLGSATARVPGPRSQRSPGLPGLPPPPHRFPRSSSSLPVPVESTDVTLEAPLLQPSELAVDVDLDDDDIEIDIDIDIDIDTVPDQPGLVHWSLRSDLS